MSEENQTPAEENKAEPETKQSYRRKVWEYLDKNNLVLFPRPYGRIPNFKGSVEAAARLLELEEFKAAVSVEVNPDKPQEASRILVLEQNKDLYVPVPRLKDGLLKHITITENSSRNQIKEAVSRRGIEFDGRTIGLDDDLKLDLLVLGSVAVSKDGYRIGKGRGYADLEFAILLEMKAITEETTIVTVVHDSQVFDTLPSSLFEPHDVPVDYILTPTRMIKVDNRLPRPPGVIWGILSKRRLDLMPVLQALKARHEAEGREVVLKEVDTDVESYKPRRSSSKFRKVRLPKSRRRRAVSEGGGESQEENGEADRRQPRPYNRTRKFFRRRRTPQSETRAKESGDTNGEENNQREGEQRKYAKPKRPFRPFRRNRLQIDFSLMVSNIEKTVRVRDLKKALNDHGVKPNDITWHGYKGFCYLHYAKPNNKSVEVEEPPFVVDNVIEILQNLKISPDSERNLDVKVMGPSRIETTDVTAV